MSTSPNRTNGGEELAALSVDDRPVLTVPEAAALLRISSWTAYEKVRTGEIPSLRLGRRILISRAALDRMLQASDAAG
jgi:excisionase family DNA binding protein